MSDVVVDETQMGARRRKPRDVPEKSDDSLLPKMMNNGDVVTTTIDHTRPLWRRLCHWGPILAIAIITQIGVSTCYINMQWWPPQSSPFAFIHMIVFLAWNYATLNNLCLAAHVGPGYVPYEWRPTDKCNEHRLQWCCVCRGYKSPRSHHCSKCQRCVMKMDHHCPWINNCVGHRNHAYFVRFLAFAVIGCIHATIILAASIYRAIFRVWYLHYGTIDDPIIDVDLYGLLAIIFAFGLSIGVICAVGFLLYLQLRAIAYNITGIEEYIVSKVNCRPIAVDAKPFVYPYNLGWRANCRYVLGNFDGHTNGDGIWWPIVDGCDQFTFTEEQIAQKEFKRHRSVLYQIQRSYSGRICTLSHGVRTCLCQPWIDGARIAVSVDEHYVITRATKYWLYGTLINIDRPSTPDDRLRRRGWFPRVCAQRIRTESDDAVVIDD